MSSPQTEDELVARYFHDHAVQFDDIYRARQRGLRGLRDRLSRGTVVERLTLARELAGERRPRRVLDVGCGSGRFAIALAEQGAEEVVGLDFAPDMLALARHLAQQAGVAPRCQFLDEDFMTWDPPARFDFGLAVGVTDYVRDPAPLLARLARSAQVSMVSFPRRWHPLVPLRWLRLRAAHCPVYFYTRADVARLATQAFARFEIRRLGRDNILIGESG
ncbi:MAG: class I SAM-dependent methyltransferase [Acidimicrobiia bacterium]|nr:class I SAM-dependent methyltransferase [Acidimicrobiia bacterium]